MSNDQNAIRPEDYEEPRCLLCGEPYGAEKAESIPQHRVIEKLDEYMSRRDYAGAEKHLLYWLASAEQGRDLRGKLLVCNELVGHYRKTGEREKAFEKAEEAIALLETLHMENSVSAGTTYVNSATAYSAFGEHVRAYKLFQKAEAAYTASGQARPALLGGLYNNMALTCASLGRYPDAYALFERASAVMEKVPGGTPERAITCLNVADTVTAELGAEAAEGRVNALLEEAYALLKDPEAPRDGYYAFVCEKCAPSFSYYGWFAAAEEFRKEAERIYAGT